MLLFHVEDEEHGKLSKKKMILINQIRPGRPLTTIPRGLPQCSPQSSSQIAEQWYPWEIEPNLNW